MSARIIEGKDSSASSAFGLVMNRGAGVHYRYRGCWSFIDR